MCVRPGLRTGPAPHHPPLALRGIKRVGIAPVRRDVYHRLPLEVRTQLGGGGNAVRVLRAYTRPLLSSM